MELVTKLIRGAEKCYCLWKYW